MQFDAHHARPSHGRRDYLGQVDYFAGGGIVADSDPAREVAETELKARMFLRSLGEFLPDERE